MRICSITTHMGKAFEELGHEVVQFWPDGTTVLDLAQELDRRGFVPDLIVHQESLGPRTILTGLEKFSCPKIFWSIDTHLNLYWHRYYARQFDGMLTPHLHFVTVKPPCPVDGLPTVGRLSVPAPQRPWRDWASRSHPVSFVGRITRHRPLRQNLARFLSEQYPEQSTVGTDLTYPQMLDLYGDTRLVPNEAILHETTFRLTESAGAGALCITHGPCPDSDAILTPGQECLQYSHVVELKSLIDWHLAHPDKAEAIARQGWERIQREHLLIHKAQQILEFAATLSPTVRSEAESRYNTALTLLWLGRAEHISPESGRLLARLQQVGPSAESLRELVLHLAELGATDNARELVTAIMSADEFATDFLLNLTCSMAGLHWNDWTIAKHFYYRHQRATGRSLQKPLEPFGLYMLWGKELMRAGHVAWPGMQHRPEKQLPQTAWECLYKAHTLHPNDLELKRQIDAMLSTFRGFEYLRLGLLSDLSLHRPDNWRLGIQLGMVNLRGFRLKEGMAELLLAKDKAEQEGKQAGFTRALNGYDPTGLLERILS